jgi:hypothetical protein
MLVIFFYIKGIVDKEFVLAGQTVNYPYYYDVLRRLRKNVRRLRLELWRQKNGLLHHDSVPSLTSSFTREFFTTINMTVVPHPPYFSVSPIEDNSERPLLAQLR